MPAIPPARIIVAEGINVIDDSEYGTKVRLADKIVRQSLSQEFYFAATHFGDSPRAIGKVCAEVGKILHAFYPNISQDQFTPIMKEAKAYGVDIKIVESEDLNDVINAAKNAALFHQGKLITFRGKDSVDIVTQTVREAIAIAGLKPRFVFSASSTGSMARGLQEAIPDAEHHVVRVAKVPHANFGKAIVHDAGIDFVKAVEGLAPLNTSFEGLAWPVMKRWAQENNINPGDIAFSNPAKGL